MSVIKFQLIPTGIYGNIYKFAISREYKGLPQQWIYFKDVEDLKREVDKICEIRGDFEKTLKTGFTSQEGLYTFEAPHDRYFVLIRRQDNNEIEVYEDPHLIGKDLKIGDLYAKKTYETCGFINSEWSPVNTEAPKKI